MNPTDNLCMYRQQNQNSGAIAKKTKKNETSTVRAGTASSERAIINPYASSRSPNVPPGGRNLLEAIRNEASRGPYQIRIHIVRPPPPKPDFFGSYPGKTVVFYELYHRVKEETHWAFRPDHFGRIVSLARTHDSGVPEILLNVTCLPKRSKTNSYVQAMRHVRLPNGNDWTISENILAFSVSTDRSNEDIRSTVFSHLDALSDPYMRELYFEQRKNNSSEKLRAEIDPSSGPMWTTLRSARSDTIIEQYSHLDMVTTTDAAGEVVREMFGLSGGPENWNDLDIASFASFMY